MQEGESDFSVVRVGQEQEAEWQLRKRGWHVMGIINYMRMIVYG